MTPITDHRGTPLGWRILPLAAMVVVATGLLSLFGPAPAQACAVCFGGEESDWTTGFVLGTIVMLSLPPLIVGGGVFAIYRSVKRQEAAMAEAEALADE